MSSQFYITENLLYDEPFMRKSAEFDVSLVLK
jgi:hypothetical protein